MPSGIADTGGFAGASGAVCPARVFWATWLGWMLDGLDSGIYIFVLVPAPITLLHAQGITVDKGHIALYGGDLHTATPIGGLLAAGVSFLVPVLGSFTNGVFALFTVWLPEMFPAAHRSFGFAFSLGRLLAAVGPTLVGAAVRLTGSYPAAITVISFISPIGVPFVLMGTETAGKPLPA